MPRKKANKVRLCPTRAQAALLAKTFGCKRFIWNKMLEERKHFYEQHGTSIGKNRKTEKDWKILHPFLKEVDSIALQQARIDLDVAYENFFAGRARFPRFKSRKSHQSYRTVNVSDNIKMDFVTRRMQLPKLGWIAYRDDRAFTERVRNVTVSITKSGRYFASILIEQDLITQEKMTIQEDRIGAFDMSAAEFLVGENKRLGNPRFYRSHEQRLKLLHRRLSRKQHESRNREKARTALARYYDCIGNRRKDWVHKVSTRLANGHDAIILEDLNIEGMKRWSGGLAKSVSLDFSWGEFVSMLAYKMAWRGNHLVKVGRFFPSSKQCSACGVVNGALALSDRAWTCPSCGTTHDRDVNASANLKKEGIRLLLARNITITCNATAGAAGSHASGDRARPVNMKAAVVEGGIHAL